METTCPHCSQSIEIDSETLSSLQGTSHFSCPACAGQVPLPALEAHPKSADGGGRLTTLAKSGSRQLHAAGRASNATIVRTQKVLNRNLLILGVTTLLTLGGVAVYLASRKGGDTFNTKQTTTNEIIHNSYFTQLIASGATTVQDLQSIAEIRPYGDGFIGIGKEPLDWANALELSKRTGSELLSIEDSTAGSRQQLIDWLNTAFAPQLSSTFWVRQDGQAKVLDNRDVLSGTSLDSPRKAVLWWRSSAGSTTTDPALANKDQPFVGGLGMRFVPIPITGGPTSGKKILFSIWETRVQDYEVFAKQTVRQWPDPGFKQEPNHPAVMVSWEDAQAFCVWLTEQEQNAGRLGKEDRYRLPSDHEWSCAVGIGEREDPAKLPTEKVNQVANVFPWGSAWPPPSGEGNFAGEEWAASERKEGYIQVVLKGYRDDYMETAPVGSFMANHLGLYDLSGNALEWCEDWFDISRTRRVLRGAAWYLGDRGWLLSSSRPADTPSVRFRCNSFRCVIEVLTSNRNGSAQNAADRERAIALITQLGGKYEEDSTSTAHPKPIAKVWLTGKGVDDKSLLQLKCLTDLISLNLNGCDNIGDAGVSVVADMERLDSLDLGHCFEMTDQGLEPLARLTRLASLKLQESGSYTYTGVGLVHLRALTNLRVLDLAYSLKLEDPNLANLKSLINLQELDLKRCEKLTDAAAEYIGELASIEKLNLAGTQVTDVGLQKIERLKQLKEITLGGNEPALQTKVTDAGVARLQKALPNLKILR